MADLLNTQLEEPESKTHAALNFSVLKLKHISKRKRKEGYSKLIKDTNHKISRSFLKDSRKLLPYRYGFTS